MYEQAGGPREWQIRSKSEREIGKLSIRNDNAI